HRSAGPGSYGGGRRVRRHEAGARRSEGPAGPRAARRVQDGLVRQFLVGERVNEHVAGWRIAEEPAQDGDDWSVVFRMDDLARDTAGPRIVLTAMAWSQTEEIEVIDEDDEPEIG